MHQRGGATRNTQNAQSSHAQRIYHRNSYVCGSRMLVAGAVAAPTDNSCGKSLSTHASEPASACLQMTSRVPKLLDAFLDRLDLFAALADCLGGLVFGHGLLYALPSDRAKRQGWMSERPMDGMKHAL